MISFWKTYVAGIKEYLRVFWPLMLVYVFYSMLTHGNVLGIPTVISGQLFDIIESIVSYLMYSVLTVGMFLALRKQHYSVGFDYYPTFIKRGLQFYFFSMPLMVVLLIGVFVVYGVLYLPVLFLRTILPFRLIGFLGSLYIMFAMGTFITIYSFAQFEWYESSFAWKELYYSFIRGYQKAMRTIRVMTNVSCYLFLVSSVFIVIATLLAIALGSFFGISLIDLGTQLEPALRASMVNLYPISIIIEFGVLAASYFILTCLGGMLLNYLMLAYLKTSKA